MEAKATRMAVAAATSSQSRAVRLGRGFACGLATFEAGGDVIGGDTVAGAFALRGFFPVFLLLASGEGKSDSADAQHHEQGAADHLEIRGVTFALQFAENENSPEQTPKLVGIGKRNAAADADIFRGVLLEEIANHPDESA